MALICAHKFMATCSPSELIEASQCFACLSKQQLQAVIAQLLCEILANGGGGGGGGGGLTCGAYGGGEPDFTPVTGCAHAIDTDTGQPWYYYSGAWH